MWKKIRVLGIVAILATLFLAACNNDTNEKTNEKSNSDQLQIVATFSIVHDILNEVGGDRVDVHSMVPIGTDPHEYDPLPADIKKATDSDAMFYSGLNLEGGKDGWFFKLADSVGKSDDVIFEVMEGVEPMFLNSDDGRDEEMNPHAFIDPIVGIQMVENTRDGLIKIDPEYKDTYEKNAEELLNKLYEIDELYKAKIADIPEESRVLVTSERAYQYMADRYGLDEGFIWAIDTEDNGTPDQIKSLVEFVKEKNVPVLFVESNVDQRPMETVSKESGVEIYGGLFSDELGHVGKEGETYTQFLEHNIETIHAGLTSKK